jgi:hypothetical protein
MPACSSGLDFFLFSSFCLVAYAAFYLKKIIESALPKTKKFSARRIFCVDVPLPASCRDMKQ